MSKSTQTETQTPTANGIIKGRPGKGRVLSLGQRAYCYAKPKHPMTEENIFRYTAKRVKGKPQPIERTWCKKCRAISRKASATARRLREAKEEQTRQREVKAELTQALPKARKAAKPKTAGKAKAKARTTKEVVAESAARVEKVADKALKKSRKAAKASSERAA